MVYKLKVMFVKNVIQTSIININLMSVTFLKTTILNYRRTWNNTVLIYFVLSNKINNYEVNPQTRWWYYIVFFNIIWKYKLFYYLLKYFKWILKYVLGIWYMIIFFFIKYLL